MIDYLFFSLVGIGLLFGIIRLIKGKSPFDRILSLDMINIILTGLLVFIAYVFDNSLFLDIAVVYAILAFLETIVFSRYLEGTK